MDQPTKNFVATNETRPLDYVCPRRDEQICASIDNKEEFTHYILEPFEANFWSMNHITPTEQAYLYFMFGVMNTYLEEDLLDTPDKVRKLGWIESSIVENFEKLQDLFTTSEKLSICQFGNDPFVFKGFGTKEGGCFWKISRRQRFSAYFQ